VQKIINLTLHQNIKQVQKQKPLLYLSYALYETIMKPIRFQKAYEYRSNLVKQKLMKIRDVEVAFLTKYGHYTADWDSLINFAKHDSIIVVKAFGTVPDSIYLKARSRRESELTALKLGIIRRDTIKIAVRDTLFKEPYDIDTLKYVPFTNLQEVFQINAGYITTQAKVRMPVFEVKVHNNTYLKGLDRQMVINLNDEARDNGKYPGLVIGSMQEVTTSGNWD
jgi:hypothetical protein